MKIVFFVGPSWHPWNPKTIAETGCGGSEIACATMAQLLAERGHHVSIYNDCGTEGTYGLVEYFFHSRFRNLSGDLLVASRTPGAVDANFNNRFTKSVLWHHDCHIYDSLTPERSAKFDLHFALSNWHRDFLCRYYPFIKNVQLTSNAINTALYREQNIERNPNKLIYSSSPNRGLQYAVQIFQQCRQQIPSLELHVYYGFDNWQETLKKKPNEQEYMEMKLIQGMCQTPGVKLHGRASPMELAQAQLSSSVWLYPTKWHETSCITAMEVQAAGMFTVCSKLAALPETVGENGCLIEGNAETIGYQKQFMEWTIKCLEFDDKFGDALRAEMQQEARQRFNWNSVCDQWCKDL
jgi:glycosyltransferase involved in cell wall biosynthesis